MNALDLRPTIPVPPSDPTEWRAWLVGEGWKPNSEARNVLRFVDGKLPELPASSWRWLRGQTQDERNGKPTRRAEWASAVLDICGGMS